MVMIKVDEYLEQILDQSSEYLGKWQYVDIKDERYIELETLVSTIEGLCYVIDHEIEAREMIEQDLHDNYRPITKAEQYEISDKDFI